ncbi:MAG: type IV secretion system DNA-binding domain-containing protein [Clostridia bacterium]|nr:type IV secretion system DNA-binding domain-containing protein [Clostridia bacterium]
MAEQVLHGNNLQFSLPPDGIENPIVVLPGTCGKHRLNIKLNEDILKRHMLLIGGTGCGKTNTFFHIVSTLKQNMTNNDVMIIFDTKGDYYKEFYEEDKDVVLSSAKAYSDKTAKWNIFSEITIDGWDEDSIEDNISEISWGLYSESIRKNSSNPFFPNAARDLFAAILTALTRKAYKTENVIGPKLNNSFLKGLMNSLTIDTLTDLVASNPDLLAVLSYVGDGKNNQGLGVLAEMQAVVRKIFFGAFSDAGSFSIRDFVRRKGAKTLFIEYDIAKGSTLSPIYKLLIDLAFKEAMGRCEGERGNVYVFCDEFRLLPDLQHIENAVNFGRSLGLKIFAGLQSIDQLYASYGEANGKNIAAGFSSVLSFRANDESTRSFMTGLYGKRYILETHGSTPEGRVTTVVEDWDISRLNVGEAVVGITSHAPFKFQFDLFKG